MKLLLKVLGGKSSTKHTCSTPECPLKNSLSQQVQVSFSLAGLIPSARSMACSSAEM